ncbi:MAG: Queuine tRNA-ribosyltransferase [Myxococcota bacterium]|nr:Queuine tRNA-ribosyltransferase [Myxococcota bacterium]
MRNGLTFDLLHTDGRARLGRVTTRHGAADTPVFMPVGTAASVKALSSQDVRELGAQIILGNTYHLYLRPGHEAIASFGGLHHFMNWPLSILTDSGGYQVFSLSALRRIREEGVEFRSHLDGSRHFLTPELAVDIQQALDSDIMMALDECPPHDAPREYVEKSMALTTRWARRCLARRLEGKGALFPIVQGGLHVDLRIRHIEELAGSDWPGMAIGGLSVGEPREQMMEMVDCAAVRLPADRPRYLMGVGTPRNLVDCVAMGVDMFDCVMPTRNARNGSLFTSAGKLSIKRAEHRLSDLPVDERCSCFTCRNASRGYLHHLFRANELAYFRFATIHNLAYYLGLMSSIRGAIRENRFAEFHREFISGPMGE